MRDDHDPTTVTPIRFDGVIDAGGDILEPPTLSEAYIEARLRNRALRVRIDDSYLGGPARCYLDELPYGSMDPILGPRCACAVLRLREIELLGGARVL
jgi:hypothetical protein